MAEYPSAIALSSLNGTTGFRIEGFGGGYAGFSVSSAGDLNGDGFGDVIVGSPLVDISTDNGEAYVVFGKADGFSARINATELTGANGFRINGFEPGANGGRSVSSAGDVNGDGIDDVIVGASLAAGGRGESYVVFGSRAGFNLNVPVFQLNGEDGFKITGTDVGDFFGSDVSSAGDVNGDGIGDLIVGAYGANGSTGESYVVFGTSAGFPSQLSVTSLNGANGFRIDGSDAGGNSGFSVNSAGDWNGDGFDDLIVGAPRAAGTIQPPEGEAYFIFGKAGGFGSTLNVGALNYDGFTIAGAFSPDAAGFAVASAGDINADGRDDFIIGADLAAGGTGAAYVIFGQGTFQDLDLANLDADEGFRMAGIDNGDRAGLSVSSAGDVNGDGFDDMLVGASIADGSSGETYVVFGKAGSFGSGFNLASLNGSNGFRVDGALGGDLSGGSVAGAGDVDGDGFADLIIGARGDLNGDGSASVLFGFEAQEAVLRTGTDIANRINGGIANDTIRAGAGDDTLFGRDGNDRIDGDAGIDTILGGGGDDFLVGSSSSVTETVGNLLKGGDGIDDVFGSNGDDTLRGGAGDDEELGGDDGNDLMRGDLGSEGLIEGGEGSDTIGGDELLDIRFGDRVQSNIITDNRTVEEALHIDGTFVLRADPDVANSDTTPHVSIDGSGAGIHFFTLTGRQGDRIDLDIDGTNNAIDTTLQVLDATGRQIVFNDDGGGDPGSNSGFDSRLEFFFDSARTIIVAVSKIGVEGRFSPLGDDDEYVLHISHSNPTTVRAGGDDRIEADQGDDLAIGEAGNDTIEGGDGTDFIDGGVGNDLLLGDSNRFPGDPDDGRDSINGGDGNDTLNGGDNNDTLSGGAGIDLVDYEFAESAIRITLNDLGNGATNGITGFGVDLLVGIEQIDAGNGNDSINGGAAANRFSGSNGADVLFGGGGNDVLNGDAGADQLSGDAGNDTMAGGADNDIYVVDSAGDRSIELANQGTDIVRSTISLALAANVENLELIGVGSLNGVGNSLNNQLTGNSSANVLNGGAGADTMTGLAGNDVYLVDNVGDRVVEAANGGSDLVQSTVTFTLGAEQENLFLLGTAAINGAGNAGTNIINGNSAANVINGLAGADVMSGFGGNDNYVVDNVADIVVEQANGGTDLIQSTVTRTLGANQENLNLLGTAVINGAGNALANRINGNSAANVLNGQAGADTMTGFAGNDNYVVDNAGDQVIEAANAGTDLVQSTIAFTLGANFENLNLIGSGAIAGSGNAVANRLNGNAAANVLNGLAGNDSVSGSGGNDNLQGEAGADVLSGGTGNDTMQGGADNDVYLYATGNGVDTVIDASGAADRLSVSAFSRIASSVQQGQNLIVNFTDGGRVTVNNHFNTGRVEAITDASTGRTVVLAAGPIGGQGSGLIAGTSDDDGLAGRGGSNLIYGNGGDDRISGGTGRDLMIGGNGDDLISGGKGGDTATGGAGVDTVSGDAGRDVLSGGRGRDVLEGGAGNDTFFFASGQGGDDIADFVSGSDTIALNAASFGLSADDDIAGLVTIGGDGPTTGAGFNVTSSGFLVFDADWSNADGRRVIATGLDGAIAVADFLLV